MDSAKAQLADKLKTANNILVTVSRNPSVDQLAACLGLTLLLNKLNKHTAAVFSGEVPSTLEFLQPDDTLEKNTDSLRDFIIALDKGKADKLRYKVEDNVVRIFITPYKTSISQDDLEFSQGDFNVDVVVALGVKQQEDLDDAITAHGRILHDATVASINISADGGLGSINWQDPQASSLSELVTELAQLMGDNLFDSQIATALLTGIVAATERFSNDKTSSQTMSASATLMAAGANQQLVATKLEEANSAGDASTNNPDEPTDNNEGGSPAIPEENPPKSDDGTLRIEHEAGEEQAESDEKDALDGANPEQPDASEPETPALELPEPKVGEVPEPEPELPEEITTPTGANLSPGSKLVTEPPSLGGMLTANTQPEGLDPSTDPLGLPSEAPAPLLSRSSSAPAMAATPEPVAEPEPASPALTPPPSDWSPPPSSPPPPDPTPAPVADKPDANPPDQPVDADNGEHTLAELEQSVNSTHLDTARDEVARALNDGSNPATPEPIQALNAQPLGDDLHPADAAPLAALGLSGSPTVPPNAPSQPNQAPNTPDSMPPASQAPAPQVTDATMPPPVPPPIPFQFGAPGGTPPQQQQSS